MKLLTNDKPLLSVQKTEILKNVMDRACTQLDEKYLIHSIMDLGLITYPQTLDFLKKAPDYFNFIQGLDGSKLVQVDRYSTTCYACCFGSKVNAYRVFYTHPKDSKDFSSCFGTKTFGVHLITSNEQLIDFAWCEYFLDFGD
jgi:hypothetical protein